MWDCHQQQGNSKGGSNFKEDQSLCGGRGGGGGEVRERNHFAQEWKFAIMTVVWVNSIIKY